MSSRLPVATNARGVVNRGQFNRLLAEVTRSRVGLQAGCVQTSRGTMFRRELPAAVVSWPGYAVLGGAVWHDATRGTCPFASYTAITDNSGGLKTWLVLNVSTPAVTYEAGPPPSPLPDNQEWFYVAHLVDVPRVTRFG